MKRQGIKNGRKKIIVVFAFLILSVLIINRENIMYNFNNLNNENAMQTNYDSVEEYTKARWTDIQNNIFGEGVASSVTDTSLSTAQVIEGNPYFNWVDTTSLEITPWNGSIKKADGTNITDADFYNEEGVLPTEEYNYSSELDGGYIDTKSVIYNVYNVDSAEKLFYIISTKCSGKTENIKINITKDIDMGGTLGRVLGRYNVNNTNRILYIEGNNHTIYNLNAQSGLFATVSSNLVAKNLNFESVKLVGRYASGVMGTISNAKGLYLENVNINGAFVQSSTGNTAVLTGTIYSSNAYVKDCSVSNAYTRGVGHIGGFCSISCSGLESAVRYDATIPDDPEATFGNTSTTSGGEVAYPIIIENSYSINSEIFSTAGHSGGFMSCDGGGIIVRNCFTNNSMYGEVQTGGFIGCQISCEENEGTSHGNQIDDAGVCEISAYFENCYSSGVVEGEREIGGFVGSDAQPSRGEKGGAAIYKNCYSTTMTGMDYSGTYVGGFVGFANNITPNITIDGYGTFTGSLYVNCYAAGEVGNIDTVTELETAKNKKIGGFMGGYNNNILSASNIYNCYYDKQTTAMREVAVGMDGNGTEVCELNGVTGVYTQESQVKGVQGLTNVDMQDGTAWVYKEGYYPQLRVFADNAVDNFSSSELVQSYSTASTATVFLNHWDEIMTEEGNIQDAEDAAKIYDTIRDITSTFEFTSNENSSSSGYDLTWQVDSETNATKGYVENLKITEEDGTEKEVPVLSIQNPVKNRGEGANFGLEAKDVYSCYDFAPGKSWVKVTVENTIGNNVVGTRKLRLLPTAYIDAGEYAEITLVTDNTDDGRVIQNNIEINGSKIEDETYKHAEDTMYVITDSENLGDNKVVYPGQIVTKDENTLNLFALWNRYPEDENASSVTEKRFDDMYSQALIGNSKDTGLAKVEVYSLGITYKEVEEGVEVPVINYDEKERVTEDALNDARWRGEELFDVDDAGWYELKYYWRLNDGRYLTDSKIVVIKGNEVSATLNNNIVKGQEDYINEELKITPDIKQATEDTGDLNTSYIKEDEDKRGVETTVNSNGTVQKTIKIREFVDDQLVAGWRNDDGYEIKELKVEVSRDGAAWVTLPLDLNNTQEAEYTYLNQNWQVKQYTDTKEYYIDPTGEPIEITLRARHVEDEENDYIVFNFVVDNKESTDIVTNSNIRVTATFVPVEEISLTKEWVDDNNALNLRPEEVTLKLIGSDGNEYTSVVNEGTNWQGKVKVPQYDTKENKIEYEIDEEEITEQYEKTIDNENYKVVNELKKYNIITRVEGEGGTISGSNENPYEEVAYGGESQKPIVITPEEGYEISKITINGVEQELPEYSLRDEAYTLDSFTNMTENKEVVVTFRENKVDIQVTKIWNDNNNTQRRPAKLKIVLKNNDIVAYETTIDVTTTSNSQVALFKNVDKYDSQGNEIMYIVDEEEETAGDLDFYTKSINNETYTITNTFTVPEDKTSVTVTKKWIDNDNEAQKRPTSIIVELRNEENELVGTQTLSDSNGWTYTFNNLQKYNGQGEEINYTVDEREVNAGDLYFYTKNINNDTHTITNTFTVPEEKISITANKVWEDNNNSARKRPTSVILQIKNGEEVVQSKTVTNATGWSCEFTDLAKYDSLGNEIKYTIDEQEANADDLKFYEKTIDNDTYTVTNTFRVPEETTSIEVTKIWEDNSNYAGKRPQVIEIQVKNGNNVVKTVEITGETDTWKATIDGLPKYDEKGDTIRYTIDESKVELYEKEINGYTITNRFSVPDEKISLSITKIWEDNNNETGARPDRITVIVKDGDIEVKRQEVEVTEENKKEYVIEDLDRYDELGNEIEYIVDEEKVEGYDKRIEGNVITNTIKKYKITTEVNGNGGTISGENEEVYEEVLYGGDAKKDIEIIPEEGYKISKITINGEEIEFEEKEGETLKINLTDVKEDKHIVVEFESIATSVLVKHVDEEGNNLVDAETITGKVGDTYKTQAKEFEEYELKEVIGNETGEMTKEQIVVTYVYSKVIGSVEVTKVDKEDSNKVIEGATFKIEKLNEEGNIDNSFEAKELTTGEDGKVKFEGLEVGRYRVTEIKAPDGYELLDSSIEVDITKENRDVKLTAENELKLVLPETGDINYTSVIIFIGIIIMLASFTIKSLKEE